MVMFWDQPVNTVYHQSQLLFSFRWHDQILV